MSETGFVREIGGRAWLGCLLAAVVCVALCSVGAEWGCEDGLSWHRDSIAGAKSAEQIPNLLGTWNAAKYPRVHYALNAAIYWPFLDRSGAVPAIPVGQECRFIALSRWLSAAMAAGGVLVTFLAAWTLFRDRATAVFGAAAFAVTPIVVLYGHLGNVDVPATFWFGAAQLAAIVLVYRVPGVAAGAAVGLLAALGVGTKDPVGVFLPGLAVAIALGLASRVSRGELGRARALLAVVAGALVFLVALALVNGLPWDRSSFEWRVGHWGENVPAVREKRSAEHVVQGAAISLYYSLGGALVLAAVVGAVRMLRRDPLAAAFALAPVALFTVYVLVQLGYSAPRFFLPGMPGLAIVAGYALAAGWRRGGRLGRIVPGAVLVLSAAYALAIGLEMGSDTRVRAAVWLRANVATESSVVALSPPWYAPQLAGEERLRFQTRSHEGVALQESILYAPPACPDYLVMVEKAYSGRQFDREFRRRLLRGRQLGYVPVADFREQFVSPASHPLGLAGWPVDGPGNIVSPRVVVLERIEPGQRRGAPRTHRPVTCAPRRVPWPAVGAPDRAGRPGLYVWRETPAQWRVAAEPGGGRFVGSLSSTSPFAAVESASVADVIRTDADSRTIAFDLDPQPGAPLGFRFRVTAAGDVVLRLEEHGLEANLFLHLGRDASAVLGRHLTLG